MARKAESKLRSAVIDALKPLHVIAVENGEACPGTPDVNYGGCVQWDPKTGEWEDWRPKMSLDGWIELKRAAMPERPATQQVKVGVRKEQPVWWIQRQRAGGKVFVLLEIETAARGRGLCFLFDGQRAADFVGKTRIDMLENAALSVWKPEYESNGLQWGGFKFWLRRQLMR